MAALRWFGVLKSLSSPLKSFRPRRHWFAPVKLDRFGEARKLTLKKASLRTHLRCRRLDRDSKEPCSRNGAKVDADVAGHPAQDERQIVVRGAVHGGF